MGEGNLPGAEVSNFNPSWSPMLQSVIGRKSQTGSAVQGLGF